MNAFDKVIGYKSIESKLLQICDMIHNPEYYIGLGKTLLTKRFIEESGLYTITVRRNKGANGFMEEISQTFRQAAANAPAIVFLDDMDKFANEDDSRRDAEEYVAVQSAIDEVKGSGVFVLATVNEIRKLPPSLKRSGRFDRKIEVLPPTSADAEAIIRHYLRDKKLSDAIRMQDVTDAVLHMEYTSPDSCCQASTEDKRRFALRTTGRSSTGGFVRRCRELPHNPDHLLVSAAWLPQSSAPPACPNP